MNTLCLRHQHNALLQSFLWLDKKMHFKAIAVDLDGTLLNSEKSISERSIDSLLAHKALGTEIIVCTGRPPRMARHYALQIGARYSVNFNGAVIFDVTNNKVKERFDMDSAEAINVSQFLEDLHPEFMGLFEAHYGWFCNNAFYKHHYSDKQSTLSSLDSTPHGIGPLQNFINETASSFLVRHPELDAPKLGNELKDFNVHCTWSGNDYLEISAKNVNKLSSLQKLCQSLNIDKKEIIAFGNAHNDVEMLNWANTSVAVENASQEAKNAATQITTSNDEDGVAHLLEQFL